MLPSRRFRSELGLTDFFNDFFENKALEKVTGTAPAMNVLENEKEFMLEVAAPGMCKDDFKVHINKDGNLVVEMEKKDCGCKSDEDKKDCRYIRQEFCYSKFSQTLLLPDNADKENIEAQMNNGILKVTIPKLEKNKEEEKNRVIEIK